MDWFYDLLATAVEGPAKARNRSAHFVCKKMPIGTRSDAQFRFRFAQDLVEVNLFTTGEVNVFG